MNYILWLRELLPVVRESPENKDKGPKSGGPIQLDAVRFSYLLRPETSVLKGVDLEVRDIRRSIAILFAFQGN